MSSKKTYLSGCCLFGGIEQREEGHFIMKNKNKTVLYSALVAVAVSGVVFQPNNAAAGGFSIREQSAEGQGASFAGIAAGSHGLSSMFFNPATLTRHKGRKFEVNAAGILPNAKLNNAVAANAGGVPLTGGNGGNGGAFAAVPATYGSYQVSDKLFLGIAINSPAGTVTDYTPGYVGRFHGVKSDVLTLNANPVVAYKVSPMLSIAFGAQVEYLDVQLTNTVLDPAPPNPENTADLTADGFGFGFTAGLTFDPTPSTQIGVGYRSQIKHSIKGKAIFSPGLGAGALVRSEARGALTRPEMITLGLRQKVTPKFTALAGFEWTNWSSFEELRIKFDNVALPDAVVKEDWRDSYFYSLGGEYAYTESTILRAGAAFEKSPVPDGTRTPRIPDNDRIWLSAGFTHEWNDWITVSGAFTHIFVKDAPINLLLADNPTRGTLSGIFKSSVDILSLSVTADF